MSIDTILNIGYALVQIPDLLFSIWDFIDSRWPRDTVSRKTKMIRTKETKRTTNEHEVMEGNKNKWQNDGSPVHEETVDVNEVDDQRERLETTENEKFPLDFQSI